MPLFCIQSAHGLNCYCCGHYELTLATQGNMRIKGGINSGRSGVLRLSSETPELSSICSKIGPSALQVHFMNTIK